MKFWAAFDGARSEGAMARVSTKLLCISPCVADFGYGHHILRYSSTDDEANVDFATIFVKKGTVTIVRHAAVTTTPIEAFSRPAPTRLWWDCRLAAVRVGPGDRLLPEQVGSLRPSPPLPPPQPSRQAAATVAATATTPRLTRRSVRARALAGRRAMPLPIAASRSRKGSAGNR